MAWRGLNLLAKQAEWLAASASPDGDTDQDLLKSLLHSEQSPALDALIRRHGSMVWCTCRQLLGDNTETEDAFQTTFLVLLKSLKKLHRIKTHGGWLHGVAVNVCLQIRRENLRRKKREARLAKAEAIEGSPETEWVESLQAVHAEVEKLPDVLRNIFVLCDLQGVRPTDAAGQLHTSVGTVTSRLTRARRQLVKRLTARGIAPLLVSAVIASASSQAAVPASLQLFHLGAALIAPSVTISTLANSVLQSLSGGLAVKLPMLIASAVVLLGLTLGLSSDKPDDAKKPAPTTPTAPPKAAPAPPVLERKIAKEPKYTGTPYYLMLAFDAEGKERSWMVLDGETLYVDLNGNGDLTDDGGPIKKDTPTNGAPLEFAVPNITVNKTTHTDVRLYVYPQEKDAKPSESDFGNTINTKSFEAQPHLPMVALQLSSAREGINGPGRQGRVNYRCGPLDATGLLQLSDKPRDASVLHFGQPYEIRPMYINTVKAKIASSFRTILGSPGIGPGAFASIQYLGTLPDNEHAIAEVRYPAKNTGDKSRTETYKFSTRTCDVNLDVNFNPGDAEGSAEVTFSYPGWKEGKVQPSNHPFGILPAPKPNEPPPFVPISKQFQTTLKHPKETSATAGLLYHPDGDRLFSYSYGYSNVVQLWDVPNRRELVQVNLQNGLRSTMDIALISTDWTTLYSWEQSTKAVPKEKDGRKQQFVECSGDVQRWDLTSGKPMQGYPASKGHGTNSLWLSPDGKYLIATEMESWYREGGHGPNHLDSIIDTITGTRRDWPKTAYGCKPFAMPDGKSVVQLEYNTKAKGYELHVRQLADAKSLKSVALKSATELQRFYLMGLSGDGNTAAVCTAAKVGEPMTTYFHHTDSMELLGQFDMISKSEFSASHAYFTPDGSKYLAIDQKHLLHIYDVSAKKVARTVQLEKSAWQQAVSPDCQWFACPYLPVEAKRQSGYTELPASQMAQGRVILINLKDDKIKPITLVAPRGDVGAVAFRPDGKQLALGAVGGIHLFDLTGLPR